MALPRPIGRPRRQPTASAAPEQPHDDHAHAHEALAPHGGRYDSILEAIGHTPMVEIPRMSPAASVRIYAKLEMANPTPGAWWRDDSRFKNSNATLPRRYARP